MYTITQAALKLEIHPRTVRSICARHNIGTLVNSRLRLLSEADLKRAAKLKKPVGNPNFTRKK